MKAKYIDLLVNCNWAEIGWCIHLYKYVVSISLQVEKGHPFYNEFKLHKMIFKRWNELMLWFPWIPHLVINFDIVGDMILSFILKKIFPRTN